jgi:CelD/BcsL family acetyltransferase involved in cellulose biosynthesis
MFEASIQNSFDFLSAEYAAFFAGSAATAFQHPRWLASLYGKLLAPNSAEPLIVVVRSRADKRLAMVLPLVRRRYAFLRLVEFADLRVTDYVSPVADARTFASILADKACVEQIRRLVRPYDLLRIGKLAQRSLEFEKLFGIPRESMGMNAYATPLGNSYTEWREQRLQRSYCKELDKKSRQLHRKGDVRFECARDPAAIRAVFAAMKIYRGLRFGGPEEGGDLLQAPAYFDFYQGMALDGRDDATRTYGLWLDDRVIAGVLGLAHKGTSFLVIMGGFDFENFKNQSIGSLMFEQVARDCIERGERYLDFTIGDEPYKMTFGAEPSPMSRIMRTGSAKGYAANLLAESMPSARAFARRAFHTSRAIRTADVMPAIVETPVPDDARA